MKRSRCTICGSVDGPAIYAGDSQCCVDCKKLASGEYTETTYGIMTGRAFDPATGYWTLDIQKSISKKAKKPRLRQTNDII